MYCEKLNSTPGNCLLQRLRDLVDQLHPCRAPRGHLSIGFSGTKNSALKKPVGIGAVVRPAVLGDDGLDLGKALDQAAHPVDVAVALLQRDRRRQVARIQKLPSSSLGRNSSPTELRGDSGMPTSTPHGGRASGSDWPARSRYGL